MSQAVLAREQASISCFKYQGTWHELGTRCTAHLKNVSKRSPRSNACFMEVRSDSCQLVGLCSSRMSQGRFATLPPRYCGRTVWPQELPALDLPNNGNSFAWTASPGGCQTAYQSSVLHRRSPISLSKLQEKQMPSASAPQTSAQGITNSRTIRLKPVLWGYKEDYSKERMETEIEEN